MKLFKCQNCSLLLFFENRYCGRCGHNVGYDGASTQLLTLDPHSGLWQARNSAKSIFKFCDNAGRDACNWLIPADSAEIYCIACRHNKVVPDLADPTNLANWCKLEIAKHRLFYSLLRLRLPMPNRIDDPEHGLAFEFLADTPQSDHHVMTGHDSGLITLALKEADDVEREKIRTNMHEPYRTLLGHFRHEIGHFYWDVLVDGKPCLEEYRNLFGDERADYSEALKRNYEQGPPADWQEHYVSTYAASHPWEDFAETWAHYMHIIDSLETSKSFGVEVNPEITNDIEMHAEDLNDPYRGGEFSTFIDAWIPLTYAINSMNRSMGLNDAYPFVLSPDVITKLEFVHRIIHNLN